MERKLKKANMSRTDYLIRILLDKEIRVCDFRGDIKAIVYELQKIGVNLNQIARNLNSGIFQDAYGNVQRMTVEHAKICKKFLDFMDEVEIREIQGG